jgi:hypothetical protein
VNRTQAGILGFIVASTIPAVVVSLTSAGAMRDPVAGLGVFPVAWLFSVFAVGLFGVPSFFLLNCFRLVRWWSAAGAGCVLGPLAWALLRPGAVQPIELLVMSTSGAVSGLAFWLVWRLSKSPAEPAPP